MLTQEQKGLGEACRRFLEGCKCPLCHKPWTKASSFPCGHTFCYECAIATIEGPGISQSECPQCGEKFWKKDLKPNATIRETLEHAQGIIKLAELMKSAGGASGDGQHSDAAAGDADTEAGCRGRAGISSGSDGGQDNGHDSRSMATAAPGPEEQQLLRRAPSGAAAAIIPGEATSAEGGSGGKGMGTGLEADAPAMGATAEAPAAGALPREAPRTKCGAAMHPGLVGADDDLHEAGVAVVKKAGPGVPVALGGEGEEDWMEGRTEEEFIASLGMGLRRSNPGCGTALGPLEGGPGRQPCGQGQGRAPGEGYGAGEGQRPLRTVDTNLHHLWNSMGGCPADVARQEEQQQRRELQQQANCQPWQGEQDLAAQAGPAAGPATGGGGGGQCSGRTHAGSDPDSRGLPGGLLAGYVGAAAGSDTPLGGKATTCGQQRSGAFTFPAHGTTGKAAPARGWRHQAPPAYGSAGGGGLGCGNAGGTAAWATPSGGRARLGVVGGHVQGTAAAGATAAATGVATPYTNLLPQPRSQPGGGWPSISHGRPPAGGGGGGTGDGQGRCRPGSVVSIRRGTPSVNNAYLHFHGLLEAGFERMAGQPDAVRAAAAEAAGGGRGGNGSAAAGILAARENCGTYSGGDGGDGDPFDAEAWMRRLRELPGPTEGEREALEFELSIVDSYLQELEERLKEVGAQASSTVAAGAAAEAVAAGMEEEMRADSDDNGSGDGGSGKGSGDGQLGGGVARVMEATGAAEDGVEEEAETAQPGRQRTSAAGAEGSLHFGQDLSGAAAAAAEVTAAAVQPQLNDEGAMPVEGGAAAATDAAGADQHRCSYNPLQDAKGDRLRSSLPAQQELQLQQHGQQEAGPCGGSAGARAKRQRAGEGSPRGADRGRYAVDAEACSVEPEADVASRQNVNADSGAYVKAAGEMGFGGGAARRGATAGTAAEGSSRGGGKPAPQHQVTAAASSGDGGGGALQLGQPHGGDAAATCAGSMAVVGRRSDAGDDEEEEDVASRHKRPRMGQAAQEPSCRRRQQQQAEGEEVEAPSAATARGGVADMTAAGRGSVAAAHGLPGARTTIKKGSHGGPRAGPPRAISAPPLPSPPRRPLPSPEPAGGVTTTLAREAVGAEGITGSAGAVGPSRRRRQEAAPARKPRQRHQPPPSRLPDATDDNAAAPPQRRSNGGGGSRGRERSASGATAPAPTTAVAAAAGLGVAVAEVGGGIAAAGRARRSGGSGGKPTHFILSTGLPKGSVSSARVDELSVVFKTVELLQDVTPVLTHLVVRVGPDSLVQNRTVKYLRACIKGCWVVGVAWVEACLTAGRLVAEAPYEATGDLYHGGTPALTRTRKHLGDPPLLRGLKFCTSYFKESGTVTRAQLGALLMEAGGTLVQRPPPRIATAAAAAAAAAANVNANNGTSMAATLFGGAAGDDPYASSEGGASELREQQQRSSPDGARGAGRAGGHPVPPVVVLLSKENCKERDLTALAARVEREWGYPAIYTSWVYDSISHYRLLELEDEYVMAARPQVTESPTSS